MSQLEIIHPNHQVTFHRLNAQRGVTSVGCHEANDIVLNKPGLPLFAFRIHHQQPPYTVQWLHEKQANSGPQRLAPLQPLQFGGYTFILLSNSESEPPRTAQAEPQPPINPAPVVQSPTPSVEFLLTEPTPKHQWLSRFGSQATITLNLTNLSPQPIPFRLTGADRKNICRFELTAPHETTRFVGEVELTLTAQQTARIPVCITPPTNRLVGFTSPIHHFTVSATSLQSGSSQAVLGQLRQSPVIGLGVMGLLVIGLAGLMAFLLQSYLTQPTVSAQRDQAVQPTPTLITNRPAWVDNPIPPTAPAVPITPTPPTYEELFQQAGLEHGLDWRILAATAYVESRWDRYAVGRDGDMGLMQIIPTTWHSWAYKVQVTAPYDPESNIKVGAAYMAHLRQYCAARGYTELRWMLVAYNWGPNNIRRLADRQGRWADVLEKQRRYANHILDVANRQAWQQVTVSR